MPLDNYKPKAEGFAAQLLATLRPSHDVSQSGSDQAEDAQDPRVVTRGSIPAKPVSSKGKSSRAAASDPALAKLLDQFVFDWFQITVANREGKASCEVGGPEETEAVDAVFRWAVAEGLHPGRVCGGHNGYLAALPFTARPDSSEIVMRLNAGSNSGIMPNVMLTGGHGVCANLAPRLQAAFPGARLSRADAALDWSQPGLFDDLLKMARLLSKGNPKLGGVRTIESDTGRTFYLGSRTSTVSLRVYEKDRERAAKGVINEAEIDEDLIRIEWTFRPQSKSKAGMFALSPAEMIRTSVWARDFMARAAAIMNVTEDVERLTKQEVVREVRERTLLGTVQHGVDQYARSFARLAAARIVERDHDGHYDTAMVDPEELEEEAIAIFSELLRETDAAARVVREERLDRVMGLDDWCASYVDELDLEPHEQRVAKGKAQRRLARHATHYGFEVSP